ncbi:Rax1p [Sporobolomyces koalae]|uniref:Rax1p n=1 Tax=Sporobolomyces koalae TaxID=500713 RepID=UPI00317CBA85
MARSQPQQQQVARNRLPSLAEVLRRNTRPPVDLYCYYLFLQREGSEDTLDFWLDVQQHENLCRAYFKDLRKSGRQVKDDWPQYHAVARTRGSIYGNVTGIRRGDSLSNSEFSQDNSPEQPTRTTDFAAGGASGERRGSEGAGRLSVTPDEQGWQRRTPSPRPSAVSHSSSAAAYPLSPTLQALYPHDDKEELRDGNSPDANSTLRRRTKDHSHHKRASTSAQPFIPRSTAINRTDLIASAERIFSRYLMPGSDKEIYLPAPLRITEFPISSSVLPAVTHPDYEQESQAQALVPDMFHAQKEFVYRSMEMDSFPRFLRSKAFGNLTGISALVRLGIGLVALWAGLATGFSLIFLDVKPKVTRLWVILPFAVGIVNLVAHSYDLDPLMVFMGLSETTPFRTIGIREPYVRKLLFGRALWVTCLSTIIIAVLTIIFWAVPGKRL